MTVSSFGRAPRARLDPIFSAADAMAVFSLQMSRPLRHEILVMFLDANSRGSTLVTVSDTSDPFCVVDVAEAMALSATDNADVESLVIASVRPGGGMLPGDDDLWLESADTVDQCGLILVDWLIIGRHGVQSPREALGMPSRWTCGT
jgi:hypothetical protein